MSSEQVHYVIKMFFSYHQNLCIIVVYHIYHSYCGFILNKATTHKYVLELKGDAVLSIKWPRHHIKLIFSLVGCRF